MKIKRYYASDMREVIQQVRAELGPDATILSNRSVDGGVEIVAAADYDESDDKAKKSRLASVTEIRPNKNQSAAPTKRQENKPVEPELGRKKSVAKTKKHVPEYTVTEPVEDATISKMREEIQSMRETLEVQLTNMSWQINSTREPVRIELLRRLMKLGVSSYLARNLADEVMSDKAANVTLENAFRTSLQRLSRQIPVARDELLETGGFFALIGPTGVGKTTTIAKLAARFALRHGSRNVSLITTDQYRVGGHEQLLSYARILDIPVKSAANSEDLQAILNGMSDKHLVLIDTSGLSHKDERIAEQLGVLDNMTQTIKKLLVLSATTHPVGCRETLEAFGGDSLHGCILSKVDESASLGGALSAVIENNLPLTYVTDGQRVPEDIHVARAHTLLSRSVSIMHHSGDEMDDELMDVVFSAKAVGAYV
jgi:flagellar biosynthesis protein FlhF